MQFAPRRKTPTTEERLANWSVGLLAGSIVMVAAFLAFAFTLATKSVWLPVAVACLGVYVAQFYYLESIGKYEPRQRLRIWLLSLLGHFILFGAVVWVVGDPSLAAVLLIPEVVSAVLHLVALRNAFKALRAA